MQTEAFYLISPTKVLHTTTSCVGIALMTQSLQMEVGVTQVETKYRTVSYLFIYIMVSYLSIQSISINDLKHLESFCLSLV